MHFHSVSDQVSLIAAKISLRAAAKTVFNQSLSPNRRLWMWMVSLTARQTAYQSLERSEIFSASRFSRYGTRQGTVVKQYSLLWIKSVKQVQIFNQLLPFSHIFFSYFLSLYHSLLSMSKMYYAWWRIKPSTIRMNWAYRKLHSNNCF